MPRYFFHIREHESVDDEEGQELADLASARECALEAARDLVCASVHEGHLNLDHYIEVADEGGTTLFQLTFREAFTIEEGSAFPAGPSLAHNCRTIPATAIRPPA